MQHKQLPRQNKLQKAIFYAKVTTAVAAGAWLSFQPLVSSAQVKSAQQQGQKTASAPVQKPATKGKAISFSDAQATAVGVVNKDSANIESRLRQYSDTVSAIDKAVPHGLTHIGYALRLYDEISKKYPFTGSRFVPSMFATGRTECYNKALLGFDAARKRGIPASIAFGRIDEGQHAILKLWDIYIDMNTGLIYEKKEGRFISFYFEASSPIVAYVAYESLGFILQDRGDFSGAIAMFGKAIALAPKAADAYLARGICYYLNYCDSLALADFYSALKIDPKNPLALFYAGRLDKP